MSTELRKEFTRYLQTQRYAAKTLDAYVGAVYGLAAYTLKPPDRLSNDDIQDYLHYLINERKLAWSSCNVVFSGLQCFYGKFLNRDETAFSIPPRKRTRKLPLIMSRDEVCAFLDSVHNLKHRTLLQTVYSAGLRVGEVVRLQPHHIESDPGRMMIRIEQGKGRKDRYTILSEKLLDLLKDYYRVYRPGEWLFPGRDPDQPMPIPTAQRIYYNAKKKPA
ncbi:MAG: phage integrase N-terminal SAM-like domain-containing protein [Desulfurivibrionaceae bacterium]|nr:phage integrase N-terminal SAM-like domain-containing protein [Desulfobulbales bacterium]MDT8335611.1 phage integrase N-terminal SAM-like domain-containing protein [Desulfurivibrionaceae bacterium]